MVVTSVLPGDRTVSIKYRERPGLTGAELFNTRIAMADPAVLDQLTVFALEALAQLGVCYEHLQATTRL